MSDYGSIDDPDKQELLTEVQLKDMARFGTDAAVCGNCVHFSKNEGQKRIGEENFIDALVKEHGWKLYMLGTDVTQLGICGEHESGANRSSGSGSLITGPLHSAKGCAGYRPKSRFVR